MDELRKNCPMRHPDNGNCTVAGGFCTAVNNPICEALHNAYDCGIRANIRALFEAEPKKNGCEYCAGEFTEYQHTVNTKLYINTSGNASALETECNPCPPYAQCVLRGIPVRSAFIINYCPNCGKKIGGERRSEDGK